MKAEKEVKNIQIIKIRPNTYQPRKYFNQDTLLELSESIKAYGVIQPISVRKEIDNFYELIAGERRLRASQLAGLDEIPAIVLEMTDSESAVIALIENLQRENLSFIEEAEGYYDLIKEHNFTQEELARRIGKKQSTIANKLRLLKLTEPVINKILENSLTERHARALLKISDEELQIKIVDEIIKKSLNVKRTEELVEKELMHQEKNEKALQDSKYKWAINPRIITNTIKQIMQKNGIDADYTHKEKDEFLEIIVRIPKV